MPFKEIPPYYHVWRSMKDRCLNPNSKAYPDYGGRGISICDSWLNDYRQFAEDMGERPKGYSLDRIDNDGDYSPENCKWSSRKEQQRNQRVTRMVVIEGKEYRAVDLADISGLKTDSIVERADQNLSYEEVICPKKRVFTDGLALGGKANGKRQQSKTHCPQGHPYDAANTRYSKEGFRRCRACGNERERVRQARIRASKKSNSI